MDRKLVSFLNGKMQQHPAVKMPVSKFVELFQNYLGPTGKDEFPRGRIVSELSAAGFAVGMGDKTFYVGGVAPRGEYKVDNGKLVLAADRARAMSMASKESHAIR
jgi:hypothetical protein